MARKLSGAIRDISPCYECTEKFIACHDRCPKDARGEPGYAAWKAKIERVKNVRKQYIQKTSKLYHDYGGNEE